MTNSVHVKANDSVVAFINSLGSGRAASAHLLDVIQDVALPSRDGNSVSLDGRPLATMIHSIERKQDNEALRAVRSIIGSVFVGAKLGKAKDKKTITVSLKDVSVDQEAIQRFIDAVAGKLSLRANLAGKVKGEQTKEEPTLKDKAANIVKWAKKEEVSQSALLAAIQAAFSDK